MNLRGYHCFPSRAITKPLPALGAANSDEAFGPGFDNFRSNSPSASGCPTNGRFWQLPDLFSRRNDEDRVVGRGPAPEGRAPIMSMSMTRGGERKTLSRSWKHSRQSGYCTLVQYLRTPVKRAETLRTRLNCTLRSARLHPRSVPYAAGCGFAVAHRQEHTTVHCPMLLRTRTVPRPRAALKC